ncbi:MAG TPA: AlpA family phage regulatory protein [Hyphomonadaceae bacterium]|nr:AlpA family phage regulatory protein [Hyphomonadaceae bacterium]HPI48661.1 AlpA family phage regulatory protein [Hyphomonadaceae bacterium]
MSNQAQLPETGFLRLRAILAPAGPIPVSKSTWWQGIKDGRFPKPLKLGKRVTVWRVEDIRKLIETGGA